jgi:hypothetical protein
MEEWGGFPVREEEKEEEVAMKVLHLASVCDGVWWEPFT